MTVLFILAGGFILFALLIGVFVMMSYNGLVTARNQFKNAFAQIDVQLKRRHDLIPNLVETAKGYLKHEQETLERVIAARNQAASAMTALSAAPDSGQALAQLGAAEGMLSGALGRLMVVSEAYPELKADASMNNLMEELKSTENRIGYARQAYNDGVTAYNNRRERFPAIMVAGALGFEHAELFKTDTEEERQPTKVSFA